MNLSILIPIYNHNCTLLVNTLCEQATKLNIQFEIVLAEDGSKEVHDYTPLHITQLRHIIRKENVGRSAIRNYLFSVASYPTMLMMDCDVCIQKNDFIKSYLKAAADHDIVCGGLVYPDTCPTPTYRLRYNYEKYYEKHTNAERLNHMAHPQFRSSCFLIKQNVTDKVHFDERFVDYGYEDVKFGKDLREAGFRPFYINNPVMNTDIEPNKVYLAKVQESLRTLHKFRDELRTDSQLLRWAEWFVKHPLAAKTLPFAKSICWNYQTKMQLWRLRYLVSLFENTKP